MAGWKGRPRMRPRQGCLPGSDVSQEVRRREAADNTKNDAAGRGERRRQG